MLNTCFLDLLEVAIEGFTSPVKFCVKLINTKNYECTQNERRGMLSWRKLQGGPASFTLESFGTEALLELTEESFERRRKEYLEMVDLP